MPQQTSLGRAGRVRAVLDAREWRALERRARRAHEADILERLQALAGERAPAVAVELFPLVSAARLRFPADVLLMAGLAPYGLSALQQCVAADDLLLTGVGRYGPHWWIAVDASEQHTILAAHLRLLRDRDCAAAPMPPGEPRLLAHGR